MEHAKAKRMLPGDVFASPCTVMDGTRWVLHMATKGDWRQPSQLEWIHRGMQQLVERIQELGILSVALPPIGCGNGGLDWNQVRPIMLASLQALPEVRVEIYEPSSEPVLIAVEPVPEPLNPLRALLVAAMARYNELDYTLSQLEIQKLAYFLTVAGAPFPLHFIPHYYGPYADNLCRVIERLECHIGYAATLVIAIRPLLCDCFQVLPKLPRLCWRRMKHCSGI